MRIFARHCTSKRGKRRRGSTETVSSNACTTIIWLAPADCRPEYRIIAKALLTAEHGAGIDKRDSTSTFDPKLTLAAKAASNRIFGWVSSLRHSQVSA